MTNAMVERDGSSKKKILITSIVFMGLSHIIWLKQYVKGAFFALIEVLMLIFSPKIVSAIKNLITLGDPHPELPIKERDNSLFMMIDGFIVLALIFVFVLIYIVSVRSALKEYKNYCTNGRFESNKNVINNLADNAFPVVGLIPMIILVLFLVVVPLLFSAAVAFTDYSSPDHIAPNNTINWVGLENFKALFGGDATWTGAFGRVAVWTLVWAFCATLTCYAGGMIMAVIFNESKLKITPVFRSICILPYAVPTVVTMLVWQNLLNGSFGTINRTLIALGFMDSSTVIPWLSDPTLAKFTCILINLWAGFPYFMLLTMGTMTSINPDIFEAAKIDGANSVQTFFHITLPNIVYQTAPLIIMSFTHNINNFGAIFFLTGGNPKVADSTVTYAKGTDIIVTWIYNLTINMQKYNYAAVLAVCIFAVLAPFAIWNFKNTKSFKDGEM